MRTQQEILDRIRAVATTDILGFEWQQYLPALTSESAEALRGTLLKADADLSEWKPDLLTDDDARKCAIDYMPFAWEKANGCRGISAGRSLGHYRAWLWLLGAEGFDDILDYQFYGKDELVRICKYLGLEAAKWDDGRRVNTDSE